MMLLSIIAIAIIATVVCLMWYNDEASDLKVTPLACQDRLADNAVTTCKLPGGFEHSEEEAYNLKHAVVSLMTYGGLPDDVVGEILDNVYAQEQEYFPGPDEPLWWLLYSLFVWGNTSQGLDYWLAIDSQLNMLMREGRDPQVEQWISEALE